MKLIFTRPVNLVSLEQSNNPTNLYDVIRSMAHVYKHGISSEQEKGNIDICLIRWTHSASLLI